jgi:DNA-binding LacI/PurR family transcriptional regulator
MEYFTGAFERSGLRHGARLPSTRQLAAHLKVSQPTVQAVLRKLAEEGRVKTKAGSGTYFVFTGAKRFKHLRIAVSVPLSSQQRGREWARQICSGIFDAASRHRTPVSLMPLSPQVEGTDAALEQLLAQMSEVDGLILFPYTLYPDSARDQLCAAYEESGKPVVFLHPPTEIATANFVTPDYYGTCRRLGQAWQQIGRRRILLVTGAPLSRSVSLRLRQAGLVSGLGSELGKSISLRVWEVPEPVTPEKVRENARAILRTDGWIPDAIYLAAVFAPEMLRVIEEEKIRVPEDLSIVGGVTVHDELSYMTRLTYLRIPVQQVGEELLEMACQRIEQNGNSLPGRIVPIPIMGGTSTRSEENDLLGVIRQGENAATISGADEPAAAVVRA